VNKERRTAIGLLRGQLEDLANNLENLKNEIETPRDEEQEYFDTMPESIQGGDKGQVAEAAVNSLQQAYDYLDNAHSEIQNAIGELEEAAA